MKTSSAIGLLIGLAALVLLFAWQGVATVIGLLGEAGWSLLLVCLFSPPHHLLGSEAWRRLFPADRRPWVARTLLASWMGTAVNSLLPVATIGGEVVKARVLTLWSVPGVDTASTAIVDKTVQAIVVLVWSLIGIAILATVAPDGKVVTGALIGAALLALGIGGFIAIQVGATVPFFARAAAKAAGTEYWEKLVRGAADLNAAIRAIYRRPGTVALAVALRLTGRLVLVGEVLLAAHLMGHPIGFAEAVLIKGLIGAVRGASFAVPGGLGLQEGGYIGIGILLGMPAQLMLAISLATRVREIVPDIPFLLAWQHTEARAVAPPLGRGEGGTPALTRRYRVVQPHHWPG